VSLSREKYGMLLRVLLLRALQLAGFEDMCVTEQSKIQDVLESSVVALFAASRVLGHACH
jgi:hypothetical protein